MILTELLLEEALLHIEQLIGDNLGDEACFKYIELVKNIENSQSPIREDLIAKIYASFGHFLFEAHLYDDALNMFRKAQNFSYSKSEIKKLVFETFIEPNLSEFKDIYEQNLEFLLTNNYIQEVVEFEDLTFWLIPTMTENEFYIYDKEAECIKEKITLSTDDKLTTLLPASDNFSDFLILEEWDWSKIHAALNTVRRKNKKSYVVINDIRRFFSCFQGVLLNKQLLSSIHVINGLNNFKKYFMESSEYLPRNIIDFMNITKAAKGILEEVHRERIKPEGRGGDNILLSICIPSYNRGKRAYENVIHNLESYYDEEIEVILSNNGTKNESKEYYKNINQISDGRLKYFAFEENQGFARNLCKACDAAKGKFILLLSDEDLVIADALDKIMNLLYNMKEDLGILRTRGDGQGGTPSFILAEPGREALMTYMLTSNYMSGIIFNNNLLKKYNAVEYVRENMDNSVCFNYPHMFWELLLCQYGKVKGTETILIHEGKAEATQVEKKEIGERSKVDIPHYASLEGRLLQHEGFLNIFKTMEICQKSFSVFREMYIKLCGKTIFLINISLNVFYKNTDANLSEILYKTYKYCEKCLEEVYDFYNEGNKNFYNEDLEQIKRFYEYFERHLNIKN